MKKQWYQPLITLGIVIIGLEVLSIVSSVGYFLITDFKLTKKSLAFYNK